jgi:hypothetical protein
MVVTCLRAKYIGPCHSNNGLSMSIELYVVIIRRWFARITYSVTCLQTASALPKICNKSAKLFMPISVQKVVWPDQDGDSEAGLTLHIITHWTHMEDMEWFCSSSSIFPHNKTASVLPKICDKVPNFLPIAAQKVAWWGLTRWFGTVSSLIGPIISFCPDIPSVSPCTFL